MDNSQDKVIWVDEYDKVLGEVTRGEAHQKGILHRIAVVYLVNDKNEILVQERVDGRLDHSSAGHVEVGEEYIAAAKRELKEELGVDNINIEEIGQGVSVDKKDGNVINHIFKVFTTHALPGILNRREVKNVFWANPKEIYADMQKDIQNQIYTNGFKVTLKSYLKNLD